MVLPLMFLWRNYASLRWLAAQISGWTFCRNQRQEDRFPGFMPRMAIRSNYPGRLLNPRVLGGFTRSMIADEGVLLQADIF
jgi:hypothetical protein